MAFLIELLLNDDDATCSQLSVLSICYLFTEAVCDGNSRHVISTRHRFLITHTERRLGSFQARSVLHRNLLSRGARISILLVDIVIQVCVYVLAGVSHASSCPARQLPGLVIRARPFQVRLRWATSVSA